MRVTLSQRLFPGLAACAILFLGCDSAPPADPGTPHFVVADVIVSVTNRSPRGLQISVGTESLDRPLGEVSARASRSFSLPSDLGRPEAPLHFEARAARQSAVTRSEQFSVAPGQQVLWTIGEHGTGPVTKR